MKRLLRLAALTVCCAIAGTCALAAPVTITAQTQWVKSDVPSDPAVIQGTLPNGMRYAIQHNTHPEHGVSFVFRVATGSFNEAPKDAGIAHFIEHMAFRGTTHIADGDVIKKLQTVGVGFGTDSNAYTSADSTVYFFDFPNNDKTTLDTGFLLTREIASELTFDPKTVDTERQVVLSESRLRDTPHLHAARAAQAALFGPVLGEASLAIGKTESISAASADVLKTFYKTNYRPERTILIIAGDVDPRTIEAEIKTRFSDWKAGSAKPAAPRYEMPDPRAKPEFNLISEKGNQALVQMAWPGPYDATPETRARDKRDTEREIAFRVLNLRLRDLAVSADPPFVGAGAGAANAYRISFITSLSANFGSGDPLRALKAMRQTLLVTLRDGVSQDEVDRAIAQQRTAIEASVTAAPSRKNNQLTNHISGVASSNSVLDAPANWPPTFEAGVKDLTAARVTAVLRELFSQHEPLVTIISPAPVAGGKDAVAAAYAEGGNLPPPSAAASAKVTWPYTDFGPAGTITAQQKIDDIGTTFITFANGVRATIKPTKYQEGQINIAVHFGKGRSKLPKDKPVPSWAVAGAISGGGLVKLSNADIPKALAGKEAGVQPDVGEGSFILHGHTRMADLTTELQFLTAVLTDPAWRPEGLKQIQSQAANMLAQAATTAPGVFNLNYWFLHHNSDKRWQPPSPEAVKAADLESVKALIEPARKTGAVEVVIVGDVSVDDTIAALKTTFGAIAKRENAAKWEPGDEESPKSGGVPFVLRYSGQSQEATAMLTWKTSSMFPDMKLPRTLRVLEKVMQQRLFDELRTKEGITYSPSVQSTNSWSTAGWGFLGVIATVPSPKLPEFYAAVEKVAADLRGKEIPADEFERARGPLVKEAEHGQETNGWWLSHLSSAQVEPRVLEILRTSISAYKEVTPADVHKAAETYLKDERSYRIIAAPEGFEIPAKLP